MDCDTTGIEPDIAIVKYKSLVGGGMMKIVNQTVPEALQRLGYTRRRWRASSFIDEHDTIEGAPDLKTGAPAHLRLRLPPDERHALDPLQGPHQDDGRRAAVHLGRDLKTVNVPNDATPEDIAETYMRVLEAGHQGRRHLPGRLQAHPAAEHQQGTPACR